jgi:ribA/ribD-fused uncharacterized protein
MERIYFYRTSDEFGCFSNFWKASIYIDGFMWPSVEHFYQASKFDNFEIRDRIRLVASPMEAATLGRSVLHEIYPDWNSRRIIIMEKALRAKFLQHDNLKSILISTKDALIVEHSENDSFWADGGDGSGKNMLGTMLMDLRGKIRLVSEDSSYIFPPWISFPGLDPEDMFWSMGLGEEYLGKWVHFFDSLSLEDATVYKRMYPEPSGWIGL